MSDTATLTKPVAQSAPHTPTVLQVRVQHERIKLAEISRQQWHVRVPESHTPEDCLDPAYLWHGHRTMRVGDMVEMADDLQRFYILAMIARIDHETQAIQLRVIIAKDWAGEALPEIDLSKATLERNDATAEWRVILGTQVLSKGHGTKAAAQAWLDKKLAQGR